MRIIKTVNVTTVFIFSDRKSAYYVGVCRKRQEGTIWEKHVIPF